MNPAEEFLQLKEASAIGAAVKGGLRRAGQLVTGSEAKNLSRQAETLASKATSFRAQGQRGLGHVVAQGAKDTAEAAAHESSKVRKMRGGLMTAGAVGVVTPGALAADKRKQQAAAQPKVASPVDEFLEEYGSTKEALDFGGAGRQVSSAIGAGLTTAAAGAVIGGVAGAANQVYTALTKQRDFKAMMDFDPSLADHHAADPKKFNQLYTSLRAANPHFGKDPVIASNFMQRMVGDVGHAGGILAEQAFRTRAEGGKPTGNKSPITTFAENAAAGARPRK